LLVVIAELHDCEAARLRSRLGSVVIAEAIWSCAGPAEPAKVESEEETGAAAGGLVLAYRSGGGMVVRPIWASESSFTRIVVDGGRRGA
jgi:hypothetical protein